MVLGKLGATYVLVGRMGVTEWIQYRGRKPFYNYHLLRGRWDGNIKLDFRQIGL
jgi:hypothetical protein